MYCDICKKEVNTRIQDLTDTFNVKGISIKATIKIRVCNECGAEVWDEQLEETNEKIVYKKYNELKGGIKC